MTDTTIPTGATIGIIGGGQLGRMLSQAADRMGYHTHVFCPEADSPAAQVATCATTGAYDDYSALRGFAKTVDVVTFEFENVPSDGMALLEAMVPVRPSAQWLYLCRNRVREKNFINAQGIATTRFIRITGEDGLREALREIPPPAILKTTELGYDGKGQGTVHSVNEAAEVWTSLRTKEAILEARVDFDREISVIVARNVSGVMQCFPPAYNIHINHILDRSIVPAPIAGDVTEKAEYIAMTLAEAGELVGLLAVELFLAEDGTLLVNELAPRPHNSGHWTMDGCATSQFEQQVRAICGLPLGAVDITSPVEMKNLVGEEVNHAGNYATQEHARVHLYGKKEIRPGRKMGHVNLLYPTS